MDIAGSFRKAIERFAPAPGHAFEDDAAILLRHDSQRFDQWALGGRGGDGGETGGHVWAPDRSRERERSLAPLSLVKRRHDEVHVAVPREFADAQQIADKFKAERPVIVNMQRCSEELASRLLDFCSGLAYAGNGALQRIDERVFLLTPRNVDVSAQMLRASEHPFFNQA